ncbi:hypothetical protein H8702_13410 [Massilimaliae timonensis]|jgi:predicted RNA-binding Zn-ribbon protein involved in translation (DUF1610 family)|uniref:Uncharacterized protein n=1 Tax=Massiliimalia timonensis TaxID=1987501 RepID=A0A8J6P955_9FIRM|nr:hypothetical protein [Massiliimalia timonensis]MBC8612090.1 hypothetical protein [Massiliimalia timonensis]
MKKIKCKTCGNRFYPERKTRYTVFEPHGISATFSGGIKSYDAFDCPACGCQIVAGIRFCEDAPVTEDD